MANREERERITPEEAYGLLKYSTVEDIYRAEDLRRMYEANREAHTQWGRWDDMLLLAFIYETGRIQGIREERAKRKH